MENPEKAESGAPAVCQCCGGPMQGHLPRHPATWQLQKSASAIPRLDATHADYEDERGLHYLWNSREQRKGRAVRIRTAEGGKVREENPPLVLLNLDVGNISWWVGAIFTVASALWIVHGIYLFDPAENLVYQYRITGLTALVGGGMFVVGSYLGLLELLNAKTEVNVGYTIEEAGGVVPGAAEKDKTCSATALPCPRRHSRKIYDLENAADQKNTDPENVAQQEAGQPKDALVGSPKEAKAGHKPSWRWIGWDLKSTGFIATFLVFSGAVIFFIPCVTGFYTVIDSLSRAGVIVLFWVPQLIASILFVASPIVAILETQEDLVHIRPWNLGWEASFWNFLGGLGFLVCSVVGLCTEDPTAIQWGVGFTTLLGSVAFTIGSYVQWCEGMNPHDIDM